MGASGFGTFIRRWWPQLTLALILVTGLAAFRADATSTDANHERRITALEETAPDVSEALTALTVQAKSTQRSVERLEDKVDRLVERGQ